MRAEGGCLFFHIFHIRVDRLESDLITYAHFNMDVGVRASSVVFSHPSSTPLTCRWLPHSGFIHSKFMLLGQQKSHRASFWILVKISECTVIIQMSSKKKKKKTRKVKSFRPSTPEKNNHTSWFKATYSVLT